MQKLIIRLPFSGFYDSLYSGELDSIEERELENMLEEDREGQHPEELRLTGEELADTLRDASSYGDACRDTARAYVAAFNTEIGEELEIDLGLEFESMTSPREYNFETDRVFAYVPLAVMQTLFERSAAEKHATLSEVIRERFTSRSGFISFYRNNLAEWLEKPLEDWDHNELETLLLAAMRQLDDWEMAVYYAVCDGDSVYSAWSDSIDWPKFEADCADLREDKRLALIEANPDYVAPPPRCPHTLDMFQQ